MAQLAALEADHLADMLDATVPAAGGTTPADDGGWTTISYAPTASGRSADGPAATRDRLATLLIARDRPVTGTLAELLLGATSPAERVPVLDQPVGMSGDVPVAAADRWSMAPSLAATGRDRCRPLVTV